LSAEKTRRESPFIRQKGEKDVLRITKKDGGREKIGQNSKWKKGTPRYWFSGRARHKGPGTGAGVLKNRLFQRKGKGPGILLGSHRGRCSFAKPMFVGRWRSGSVTNSEVPLQRWGQDKISRGVKRGANPPVGMRDGRKSTGGVVGGETGNRKTRVEGEGHERDKV